MLQTFDHVTLAVRDLAAAGLSYERLLGRAPIARGHHPSLGTAAQLFGFVNGALELLAPEPDRPEAEGLTLRLAERGEGLITLAFGTHDGEALSAALRERGIRATKPQPGDTQGADGSVRSYRTVELSPRSTRGVHVLAVERKELGELRAASEDPSALCAIDHVVLRTSDVASARTLYSELGLRLALEREFAVARMLFFRVGGVTVEVVEDRALGAEDVLHGLAYRTRDLDGAHARLERAGFELSPVREGRKPGTQVFTVRSGTAGVPTLVLRDPTRE